MGPLTGCVITWWCRTSQGITRNLKGHQDIWTLLQMRCSLCGFHLWSAWVWCVRKGDSLILRLEMFLDKAVLDSRLRGLGLVRRQHLLHSTGALQHRGGHPWTHFLSHIWCHTCQKDPSQVVLPMLSQHRVNTVGKKKNICCTRCWCKLIWGNPTEALVEHSFSIFFLFPGN